MGMMIVHEDQSGHVMATGVWDGARDDDEPEADFLARMVAAVVVPGARHVVIDDASAPNVPPERWVVNWVNGTIAVAEPTPDEVSAMVAAAKSRAIAGVIAFADQMADAITGHAPLAEKLSWSSKESAAVAHLAGTATVTQTTMLSAEAGRTGETVAALAAKIAANAAKYHVAAGLIAGQRRRTVALIEPLSNPATIAADIAAILATSKAEAEAMLAQVLGA